MTTVLIADADADARTAISRILDRRHTVIEAASGSAAVCLALRTRPDLVMLDGDHPAINGFATCALMRNLPPLANVPIIMLTTRADEATASRAEDHGANDYLFKPLILAQVRARLHAWLLRSQPRVNERQPAQ